MAKRAIVRTAGSWIQYATFLGTVHHELSHALLAVITGAKLNRVSLLNLNPASSSLGSVTYTCRGTRMARAVQSAMSSFAPMLLGSVSLYFLGSYVFGTGFNHVVLKIFLLYLMFSIFVHMSLSKQDVKNILSEMVYLVILLYIIFYLFGLDFLAMWNKTETVVPIKIIIQALREKYFS
jgi:hypothetical protein